MNSYPLVFADDNVLFPQVYKIILTEKPGIEVIGEAPEGYLVKEDINTELFPTIDVIHKEGVFILPLFDDAKITVLHNRRCDGVMIYEKY